MALTLEQISVLAPELADWWASAGLEYLLSGYERPLGPRKKLEDLRRFARPTSPLNPGVIGVLAPGPTADQVAAWLRQRGKRPLREPGAFGCARPGSAPSRRCFSRRRAGPDGARAAYPPTP